MKKGILHSPNLHSVRREIPLNISKNEEKATPPFHGGDHGFESRTGYFPSLRFSRYERTQSILPSRLRAPKQGAERPDVRKTMPPFAISRIANNAGNVAETCLDASRLTELVKGWILSGDIAGHSERTLQSRKERLANFLWFVDRERFATIGKSEAMAFLAYLRRGHNDKRGRFGNPRLTEPLSSGTIKTYYQTIRTFFNWCVMEGAVGTSPLEGVPIPIDRPDQIMPFSEEEIGALEKAANAVRRGKGEKQGNRKVVGGIEHRDAAIFYLLLDTGIRATELCSLQAGDIDLASGRVTIRSGKGGKGRAVPISRRTKHALVQLLRAKESTDEYLFTSTRGTQVGEELSRLALMRIVNRWCDAAGITAGRRGPHRFRHSFSIQYLRAGGDPFTLKEILGHESLVMTNRYVALAKADISRQHAKFSPVEQLRKGKRAR